VREKLPSASSFLFLLIVVVLLWLILIPMGQMILSSFRAGHPAAPGPFTFDNYRVAYTSPLTYRMILNTLIFSGASTALSVLIAILFAWLIERTDMPLKSLCWTTLLIPLAMPGLFFAMAYVFLLMPQSGVLNLFLRSLLDHMGIALDSGPLNIYSLGGMIFLDGIRGVTTVFLLIVGSFRLMDPALEEASWTAGAGNLTTIRKVTLPVLLPAGLAAVLYCFTSSMESFEAPLVVGLPGQVFVYSTMIYLSARGPLANYGLGGAFAVSYLLMALVLVYLYQRATLLQTERFATVTGKGYRPRVIDLGRWRYAALGFFLLYFLFTVVLPFGVLIWVSLLPSYRLPSTEALALLTIDNYRLIFNEPNALRATWNTILLTLVTATATIVLAFAISWVVVRTKVKGRLTLDGLTFASHAVPGLVVAISFIFLYLQPPFKYLGLYGTILIVSLALITQYVAFATRTTNAAITQIHKELEEAGEVSGATRLQILSQITLPLIRPPFIAAWVWVAAHAMRAFAIPFMLSSRENQTLSVLLWQYWDEERNLPLASALGVLLTLALACLTFFARAITVKGFRQG
jgi:iron(III) transport system permease protein